MKIRNRKSGIRNGKARLIVAASETDPDMLYATKFWAPDPFIFLEQNGKRTLVLSDLEIDRGRKQAKAHEFVPFSELEREVQGRSKKTPPYEKVLAHFLRRSGDRARGGDSHRHNRRRWRPGLRSARTRVRSALRQFVDHPRRLPPGRQDRLLRRHDPYCFARSRQRGTAKTLGDGEIGAAARLE